MTKKHSTFQAILATIIAPLGLILVLISTAVPFFMMHIQEAQSAYPWVYSVGAFLLLVARLFTPYTGKDLRLKRLYRIESWIPAIFLVGVFFLFYKQELRDWMAFTLAGAIIQIYTSIAIPLRESKVSKQN